MATSSMFCKSLLKIFLVLFVTCNCSLGLKNVNIYRKYFIVDSCTDDENIIYELSETGIHSVAKIGAYRNSGLHYGARNCTVTVKPPSGYSVYLQTESFRFGYSYNRSSACTSYIQVSGNGTTPSKLCGFLRRPLPTFTTYGNMTILFHTENDYLLAGLGFTLIATAYKTSSCMDRDYFICDNGRCIWKELICDGINNCGDDSDEMPFARFDMALKCYPGVTNRGFGGVQQDAELRRMKEMIKHINKVDFPELPHFKLDDVKPFTIRPFDFDFKVTFSPDIVSYRSSHTISVGAALTTAVFVILGAFVRFYCYYQCNQARRQQVLSAVTIIRARSVLRQPPTSNAAPPPPYETLVNVPEGQPENPPEYTNVSEVPSPSASCNAPNTSTPSQHPTDKNENVSCGPPPPYEP